MIFKYLHDTNNGSAVIREVPNAGDDISGVKEGLSMGCHEHEETHSRHRWPRNHAGDCSPHEEVAQKALYRSGKQDNPRASSRRVRDGRRRVENTGECAAVDSDVLEDRDGVESGLVVLLGGLQDLRVYRESVKRPTGALNPYAAHRRYPLAVKKPVLHFSSLAFFLLPMVSFCVIKLRATKQLTTTVALWDAGC